MLLRRVLLSIVIAVVSTTTAAEARVRVLLVALDATHNEPIVPADPLEAIDFISARLNGLSNVGWACGVSANGGNWVVPVSSSVKGDGLVIQCPNNTQFRFRYAEATLVYVSREGNNVWAGFVTPSGRLHVGFGADEQEAAIRFQAVVRFLASRRTSPEPAADADFQAAIAAAGPRDLEDLRRTQVQAEASLQNDRIIEAARLYRAALSVDPRWGDGHYNLGLVYEQLGLYPEAITEMRRYLYLTPNAQDAREVQDKIYQWEAAIAR